jgi:pSer/pThr/pTyr-binding forkhead associated (FHA) protein
MPSYPCPKGHESTEPDFCSDCGAKIFAASDQATIAPAIAPLPTDSSAAALLTCPDCSTPHENDSGDFCEICGYNFVSGAHGELAIAPAVVQTAPPLADNSSAQAAQPSGTESSDPLSPLIPGKNSTSASSPTPTSWQLQITLDATPHHTDSPPTPAQELITLTLAKPTNLIGRTSQARANYPEIAIDFDDAISHRHAVLTLQTDLTLSLRDIGSSNGTELNGVELAPMTDTPVSDGDQITLGHWTRITVVGIY